MARVLVGVKRVIDYAVKVRHKLRLSTFHKHPNLSYTFINAIILPEGLKIHLLTLSLTVEFFPKVRQAVCHKLCKSAYFELDILHN